VKAEMNLELNYRSWNPIRGCSRVSDGCLNCYAERFAYRLSEPGQPYHGLAVMTRSGPRWTGKIRLVKELVEEPLRWRKPSMVFVNSMSDVFHKDVPDKFISDIFTVMSKCFRHTFFIITKRPQRMLEWVNAWRFRQFPFLEDGSAQDLPKNVWLGISVENQEAAQERIPLLLQIPSAIRFLCCEPLLGPVDLSNFLIKGKDNFGIDWVIVGSESGYGARPMDEDWVRVLRDQCIGANIKFCFKQKRTNGIKVSDPELDGMIWDESPEIVNINAIKAPAQLEFDFGD
jgi:protein gp37